MVTKLYRYIAWIMDAASTITPCESLAEGLTKASAHGTIAGYYRPFCII